MRLNKQVLCIIFRDNGDKREFLLLLRVPDKGAFWQPPSGGVEDTDKDVLATIYREIKEETGIVEDAIIRVTPEVHRFIIDTHYITGEPSDPITEYVFGVEVKPDVTVTIDNNIYPEHDAYLWVSYDEAFHMLKWKNNKDGFEKLLIFLQE